MGNNSAKTQPYYTKLGQVLGQQPRYDMRYGNGFNEKSFDIINGAAFNAHDSYQQGYNQSPQFQQDIIGNNDMYYGSMDTNVTGMNEIKNDNAAYPYLINLMRKIKSTSRKNNMVIVFVMNGCGYCEQFKPIVAQGQQRAKNIVMLEQSQVNPILLQKLSISGFPTTVVVKITPDSRLFYETVEPNRKDVSSLLGYAA